jgi:glucosamine--fructose-6-phosphate aminotransferase (isomerizing)
MCGIIGYLGDRDVAEVLLEGLRRLEYRGYDSAGIALIDNGELKRFRAKGKVRDLAGLLGGKDLNGSIGIGHTRWATHGRPCEENAHPHTDAEGRLCLIHNGIVENYHVLKEELATKGHEFASETDTEVLCYLIADHMKSGKNLFEAVRSSMEVVEGSYSIAVISLAEPEKIVCSRLNSPLILGLGEGENFVASDIPAILGYTSSVIFLKDREIAVVERESVGLFDEAGNTVKREPVRITWDPITAQKGGYKHFMLKEIFEQPHCLAETISSRLDLANGEVFLEEMELEPEYLREGVDRLSILACGTSWHSALVGKFLIEKLARLHCDVDYASEYRYRNPLVGPRTLALAISQSGETTDTLMGMREALEGGSQVISICNVLGSSIPRECRGTVYTRCGPEIGVASTKAFTAQIAALNLLAVHLAGVRGTMTPEERREYLEALAGLPALVERMLKQEGVVRIISRKLMDARDFLYLARGINYPIALEGALKLKEISYIHAEGYPAGEMKHGPIALVEKEVPSVFIAPNDKVYEKTFSNIREVKARDGMVVAIATEGNGDITEWVDEVIYLPECREELVPILATIPLQLLAYHIAVLRGCDVDQPRNLAKSVTVE